MTTIQSYSIRTAITSIRGASDSLHHRMPASYANCQEQVSAAWQDGESWTKMSILNTARSGKFSSDRAIAEYCDDIWKVWPLTVTV
jgi:glucan phosphorylase